MKHCGRLEKELVLRKHRTHLQIVTEVLDKCIKPQKKTSLMYSTNLSYKMVTDYLSELQEAELLEVSALSENKYFTTAKGREYLKRYREVQAIADLPARS